MSSLLDVMQRITEELNKLARRVARLERLEQPSISQINLGESTGLTIASGAITVTHSYHTVDTEASAATDDLTTISGGSTGDILILRAADSARTVVVKDGAGLALAGDCTLDNYQDTIVLLNFNGTIWLELCRSDNAA